MMNGISQNVIDPTQNIGEGIVEDTTGESIAQFAAAVHSNPEKAEQRRTATLKQGNKLPIDNILPNGESEGKAIEQFAAFVFI